MPRFRITIVEEDVTSDGVERHRSFSSARASAVRTATAILLDTGAAFRDGFVGCEVRNELNGDVSRFDVAIALKPKSEKAD